MIRLFLTIITAGFILVGCHNKTPQTETVFFDPLIHDWPHDISDLPVDPNITYGKLENGLRYALRNNSYPENEASLRFWIKAGSMHETPETIGLAHFLEHMAFNGSENVPEGEMVKSLERLGLAFGADTNASTTYRRTQYQLSLPSTNDETVDYALFLMRETADKLLIAPDAVDRERGVVIAEEARGNTPSRKASRAYRDWAYPDLRRTEFNVIGKPETLGQISAQQLRDFYETYYRPERAVLVLVGDFDIAEMEAKIKITFGDWVGKGDVPPEPDDGTVSSPSTKVFLHGDEELSTSLTMHDVLPPSAEMDSLNTRKKNLIRSLANGAVNQRMSKLTLGRDAETLGGNIFYSKGRISDIRSASASAKKNNWNGMIKMLDRERRKASIHGFQQAEIDALISNYRRSYTDSAKYAAKRRSGSLASGIISSFASGSVITTPEFSLENFERGVKDITLDDITESFEKMWADFNPHIWLQGEEAHLETEDSISNAYERANNTPISKPKDYEILSFAYQDFGSPGKVVWEGHIDDFDITQKRFANNVHLNMKPTDFEDNWINLSISFGEGWTKFPIESSGLTSLASSLSLGGFKDHPAKDLAQIFAGKRVSVGFGIGTQRLRMRGSTNPDDVGEQLKIWTALLTAPGYREEWLTKYRDEIESSFHTLDSTPGGVAARDLSRIWHNGDPRYGMSTKQQYLSYTLDDVRNVFQTEFDTGAIEIGIVGDFDKDVMTDLVAKTFGALPKRNRKFTPNLAALQSTFPKPDRVMLTHTGAANQGAIYMAWPMVQDWTVERRRHYTIIRSILSNRLIEIIREDLGLSYSPSAGLNFGKYSPGYGYLSTSISADPQFFEAFEKAAKTITADMRSGDITEDELNRARKPILENMERGEKENGNWLGLVARSQTVPESLDRRRSRKTAYETMTAADLNTVVADLFDPAGLHIVTILPEDKPIPKDEDTVAP